MALTRSACLSSTRRQLVERLAILDTLFPADNWHLLYLSTVTLTAGYSPALGISIDAMRRPGGRITRFRRSIASWKKRKALLRGESDLSKLFIATLE